jgi:8-oxo-dGTP pyrophosphatase MutT (NUDIX family)/phosphohistidine phosphatase SixA
VTLVALRSPTSALRPAIDAAGALVWRVREGRLEVLLIHRPRYDDWSWPKGKLEQGESSPDCAVREVAEETGENVILGARLPGLTYRLTNGVDKVVDYWAAHVASPRAAPLRARPGVALAPMSEIDDAEWLDAEAAGRRLTRSQDRLPLDALVDLWRTDRLRTWAIVFARHGRATKRSAWRGTEAGRPLTPEGVLQANALVPVLAAFGVAQVISSPWARCEKTLRPYAKRAGLTLELEQALTETSHKRRPLPVRELVAEHLSGGRSVVISTHRPVLPSVLRSIEGVTPKRLTGVLPQTNPYLRPGEALVVHMAHRPARTPRAVAIETWHPRPDLDA